MDKDHRPLPRFADIQSQNPNRTVRDEGREVSELLHSSVQGLDNRPEPAPPPLLPPMQSHQVRAETFYPPASTIHRQVGQRQFPHHHRPEAQASPQPVYSQSMPAVPNYDRDRIVHSQSPSVDNVAIGVASVPFPTYSRQQQSGSVAEGGVAKPKKLHREVEQKRRMRMAEQIVELRKWVSNPNGGKTDKVSVLQDAVTFVKDSAKKIEELQDALERSRTECSHLRSILNKSQTLSTVSGPQPGLPTPAAHVAPIAHLSRAVHPHAGGGVFDSDGHRSSHLSSMQTAYHERHIHPGVGGSSLSRGGIGGVGGPSNFVVAPNSSLVLGGGSSGQATSQAFEGTGGSRIPSVSSERTTSAQRHRGPTAFPGGYYVQEGRRMMTSAPVQSFQRLGQDLYQGASLPRLHREGEEPEPHPDK